MHRKGLKRKLDLLKALILEGNLESNGLYAFFPKLKPKSSAFAYCTEKYNIMYASWLKK